MNRGETALSPEVAQFANTDRQQEHDKLRQALLDGMVKFGAISYQEGRMVLDVDALKNWSSRQEIYGGGRKLNQNDIIQLFSEMNAVPKTSSQGQEPQTRFEQPVVVLPESLPDLFSAENSGYGERNKSALLEPWEIGKKHKSWTDNFILKSGEKAIRDKR